jgi:hypothetical protein
MPRAYLKIRPEPFYRRDAFEQGLKRLGYTFESRLFRPESRDDLYIAWNVKAGSEEQDALWFERCGGTFITTENGYLQKVDKTHYAISTHGHNGSGWFPWDPREDRFSRLGFPIHERRHFGGQGTIVIGQRGIGSSLMRSPPGWGERTARSCNGRLRVHPGVTKPRVAIADDLARADTCMIWSSACGVLALTMGLVVTYSAPRWICEGGAGLVSDEEKRIALHRMAHAQWAVSEIAAGEPFARMREENWGPTWP